MGNGALAIGPKLPRLSSTLPDQGTGATAVVVLRSTGEPGKASPIRGGGRTAKRMRRREPGKIVAVWSSIPQRAWAARVRCGELSGAKVFGFFSRNGRPSGGRPQAESFRSYFRPSAIEERARIGRRVLPTRQDQGYQGQALG